MYEHGVGMKIRLRLQESQETAPRNVAPTA
jgi:hypothetical protein